MSCVSNSIFYFNLFVQWVKGRSDSRWDLALTSRTGLQWRVMCEILIRGCLLISLLFIRVGCKWGTAAWISFLLPIAKIESKVILMFAPCLAGLPSDLCSSDASFGLRLHGHLPSLGPLPGPHTGSLSPFQALSSSSPCSPTQCTHRPCCALNVRSLVSPPGLHPCRSLCLGCVLHTLVRLMPFHVGWSSKVTYAERSSETTHLKKHPLNISLPPPTLFYL